MAVVFIVWLLVIVQRHLFFFAHRLLFSPLKPRCFITLSESCIRCNLNPKCYAL